MTQPADYFNNAAYLEYLKTHQAQQNTSASGRVAGSDLAVEIIRLLSIKPGAVTVEIGCGIGRIMHLLHAVFGATVHGCDVSLPAVEHIRQSGSAFAGNVHHRSGDQLDFLESASVDCVVMWGVFELTDQRRTLLEISRVLKPGGVALLGSVKNRAYLPDDEDSLAAHRAYIAKSIPISYSNVPAIETLIRFLGMEIKQRAVFKYKRDLPDGKYALDLDADEFSEAMYIIEKVSATPADMAVTIAPRNEKVKA